MSKSNTSEDAVLDDLEVRLEAQGLHVPLAAAGDVADWQLEMVQPGDRAHRPLVLDDQPLVGMGRDQVARNA